MCSLPKTFGLKADERLSFTFKIFGIGGAGCNMVANSDMRGIAIGSDARDLNRCHTSEKLVMSAAELFNFANTNPDMLTESIIPTGVKRALEGIDISLLVAGLGGGTGSDGIRFLASASNIMEKMPVCFVSMPFKMESEKRRITASRALEDLKKRCDLIICFENDKLLELVPQMPLNKAFNIMNSIMERPIIDISRVMTASDIPSFRQIAQKSIEFRLGVGLGIGRFRDIMAIKETFESPWINFDPETVSSAYVIISSKPIDEKEIDDIIKELSNRMPNSELMIGSYEDSSLDERLRITLIAGKKLSIEK